MSPHTPNTPHDPTPGDRSPSEAANGSGVTSPPKKQGLMRSLGQFTGHVFGGIKAPATPPATTSNTNQTHKSVEEQATTDEQGRTVVLRRTTIEEVETKDG